MTPDELERWMEAAGYFDPADLGEALGVHRTTVERWLKGESELSPANLRKVLQLKPKRLFAKRFEEFKAQREATRKADATLPQFELTWFALAPRGAFMLDGISPPQEVEPDFPRDAAPVQPAAGDGSGARRGNLRPVWRRRPLALAASLVGGVGVLMLAFCAARSRHPEPAADEARAAIDPADDFAHAPEMLPLDESPADAGVGESESSGSGEAGAKKGKPLLDKPLEGQLRAPCPTGYATINGGCWLLGVDKKLRPLHAPCPETLYEYEDYCYKPEMGQKDKRLPNTVEPKTVDGR